MFIFRIYFRFWLLNFQTENLCNIAVWSFCTYSNFIVGTTIMQSLMQFWLDWTRKKCSIDTTFIDFVIFLNYTANKMLNDTIWILNVAVVDTRKDAKIFNTIVNCKLKIQNSSLYSISSLTGSRVSFHSIP